MSKIKRTHFQVAKIEIIILLNFIQSLFILIFSINFFLINKKIDVFFNFTVLPIELSASLLLLVSIILIITNTYMVYLFSRDNEDEKQQLIENLRKQRHEFINHLESLSYFLNNNEIDEAQNYLNRIGVIITTQSQLDKLKNASFASVINNFMSKCESKGIYFEFNANSELNNFPMSCVHITTVFSNVLNNALEHCGNEGIITLEILENKDEFNIIISNTGQPINQEIDIFQSGTSTKGEGRGYGLSLVKDILEKYKGEIYIKDYYPPTFIIKLKKEDGNENHTCR